jgi:hypothetical protein
MKLSTHLVTADVQRIHLVLYPLYHTSSCCEAKQHRYNIALVFDFSLAIFMLVSFMIKFVNNRLVALLLYCVALCDNFCHFSLAL